MNHISHNKTNKQKSGGRFYVCVCVRNLSENNRMQYIQCNAEP